MGRQRPSSPGLDLLADVGGTNARFALARNGAIERQAHLAVADYGDPTAAITDFLGNGKRTVRLRRAALAVAGPVDDGRARLTNGPWCFSAHELESALDLERAILVNDFAALAWAIPALKQNDLVQVGGGAPVPASPKAVIGPGTGLGMAGLVPDHPVPQILVTEGGHVTMAAVDADEDRVLALLRGRFGHVSAERVVSGEGLVNLYTAMAEIDGAPAAAQSAAEITRSALAGDSPLCRQALNAFCAMCGTVAGNLALTLGARGGVYIAGGIVPRFIDYFAASQFRARFEAKGRFHDYLAAIPTWVVVHPEPAFLGLMNLLAHQDEGI